MPYHLLLGTDQGLHVIHGEKTAWGLERSALQDTPLTSLAAGGGYLLAGTTSGIYRSEDGGRTWQPADKGLAIPHVRWLAVHPEDDSLAFAGTEPAGLFFSQDRGQTWAARSKVEELRDENRWMLPYSPQAGCVRGFAFHGDHAYAAVEVGGLLASEDRGRSWALVPGSEGKPTFSSPPKGFLHPDVHSVAVHPSDPDLVYAPTGGGFFRSEDGGASWEQRYNAYSRAVWVDPKNPDHILLGPADGVGRRGRIERSRDGGKTWQDASQGLDTPWPSTLPERFTQAGKTLFCILDDGRLLAAEVNRWRWKYLDDFIGVTAAIPLP